MAEMLKQTYDLVVLKVRALETGRSDPAQMHVRFVLQGKINGQLRDLSGWEVNEALPGLAELFRGSKSRHSPTNIELPPIFWEQFEYAYRQVVGGRPLWVHLVEPYGALRFVPWERLLGDRLHVPVLMLPDFIFPRPREAASVLDVVVCASAPLGHEEHSVREALLTTVGSILVGSPRATRVHVFTDQMLVGTVKARYAAEIRDGKVLVHEPSGAARFVTGETDSRVSEVPGMLRSPWLLWMRDALRDRAVDVVHFCCHGFLTRGRGVLLFAQSPLDRSDSYLSAPVCAVELQAFLTQVGAWSSAFESLPDNSSEHGLRALADEIAQSRPGPMLMHSLVLDPAGAMLAAAYRFVYAASPGEPPRSTALFLYCQPYLTTDAVSRRTVELPHFDPRKPPLPFAEELSGVSHARNQPQWVQANAAANISAADELVGLPENPLPWVAATERMADSMQLRFQEMARDEVLPGDLVSHKSAIADRTLEQLRKAVADLAKRRGTKGTP